MLRLKRIVHPFDFMYDSTGDVLMYGDFYYQEDEPDENGKYFLIRATTYHQLRKEAKEDAWDYSTLNNATSLRDYERQLKDAEHELAKESILSHKIQNKPSFNNDVDSGTVYNDVGH